MIFFIFILIVLFYECTLICLEFRTPPASAVEHSHLGAARDPLAGVEAHGGVPAVAVQRHAVPLVEQHRLAGPHHALPGAAVEPAGSTRTVRLILTEETHVVV